MNPEALLVYWKCYIKKYHRKLHLGFTGTSRSHPLLSPWSKAADLGALGPLGPPERPGLGLLRIQLS